MYLTAGEPSKFVITAIGNEAAGFCYVLLDGEEYVTETMEAGEQLTFYVKVRRGNGYESASDSGISYQIATGNDADREADEEKNQQEIELAFIPQLGESPMEGGASVFGLTEGAPSLDDMGELAYVISDGDTLYCGQAQEPVTPVKPLESMAAAKPEQSAVTGDPTGTASQNGAAGNATVTEQVPSAGETGTVGETVLPEESSASDETGAPGESGVSDETGVSGESGASDETVGPGESNASDGTTTPEEGSASGETAVSGESGVAGEAVSPGESGVSAEVAASGEAGVAGEAVSPGESGASAEVVSSGKNGPLDEMISPGENGAQEEKASPASVEALASPEENASTKETF